MITLTVTATCGGCPWTTTGPGSQWDDIQRQADKHTAPGHPTAVTAVPAAADVPAQGGAAQKGTT